MDLVDELALALRRAVREHVLVVAERLAAAADLLRRAAPPARRLDSRVAAPAVRGIAAPIETGRAA